MNKYTTHICIEKVSCHSCLHNTATYKLNIGDKTIILCKGCLQELRDKIILQLNSDIPESCDTLSSCNEQGGVIYE